MPRLPSDCLEHASCPYRVWLSGRRSGLLKLPISWLQTDRPTDRHGRVKCSGLDHKCAQQGVSWNERTLVLMKPSMEQRSVDETIRSVETVSSNELIAMVDQIRSKKATIFRIARWRVWIPPTNKSSRGESICVQQIGSSQQFRKNKYSREFYSDRSSTL